MTDAEMRFTNGELAALLLAIANVYAVTPTPLHRWTPDASAWLAHAKAKLEADLASRL